MRIYSIKNTITNKIYVGQTIQSVERRFRQHCQRDSNSSYLVSSISKYGKENFIIREIEECTSLNELNEREEFWIKELSTLAPNGYNLTTGGAAPKHSEETKKKMSETRKGKHPSWATEASRSEAARSKRSESHKKIAKEVWTDERKDNCRIAAQNRMKRIIDENGITYESVSDAARKTGCHRASIQKVLKGEQKSSSNKDKIKYRFSYG